LIGMIQTLTTAYISTELSDAVVFGLLFIVLLARPNGFFSGLHTEYRVA
jgi:branched-chain amino acid transport system permease protein